MQVCASIISKSDIGVGELNKPLSLFLVSLRATRTFYGSKAGIAKHRHDEGVGVGKAW